MGVIYINGPEQEKQGYLSRFPFQIGLSITGRGQLQRRLDHVDTNTHTCSGVWTSLQCIMWSQAAAEAKPTANQHAVRL